MSVFFFGTVAQDLYQMAWPVPQFSKADVNRAGTFLAAPNCAPADLAWAHGVLGNWRACHGYPMNTFQATLRDKLERANVEAIVAQRLKRTPSIIAKLRRFDTMRLARMQDIGGLRAVVPTVSDVRELQGTYQTSRFKHELVSGKDYIHQPPKTGYRSVHLVYRYLNNLAPNYNGLSIELQIRSRLQHAWATSVETMGTFLGQALKSRQGDVEWLEFFAVTGSAFAHIEGTPLVPGYEGLTKAETYERVANAERDLGVLAKLAGFSHAVEIITAKGQGSYHLITLDSLAHTVSVDPYSASDLSKAMDDYARAEARVTEGEPIEAVLVSAGTVGQLKRAYPNYFLDTIDFVKRIRAIIQPPSKRRRVIGRINRINRMRGI